jgi:hypothetical protein
MRAALATAKLDHISRSAVSVAGLACGALVFFVAAPLALSSPFPTTPERDWIVRSPMQLASFMSVPAVIEPPVVLEPEAKPTLWDFVSLPAHGALARLARYGDGDVTGSIPSGSGGQGTLRQRSTSVMTEVDDYLWEVYQRAPIKKDGAGDFTWKDPAAAKRFGLSMPGYVIGGMDPEFREQLYHAGRAMDAAGVRWAILSAFRDDYRQSIASGLKASASNSLHGGRARTGGYGHGQAVDVTSAEGDPAPVWKWLDKNGAKFGLHRPLPGADPAHVQTLGPWKRIAVALREGRVGKADEARTRTADVKPSVVKASW